MKQIKTIVRPLERAEQFDLEVNELLCAGWEVKKRGVITKQGIPSEAFNSVPVQCLYAELEWESKK